MVSYGRFIIDERTIDFEVITLIFESYKKVMKQKNAMFYNKDGTIIKNKQTGKLMGRVLFFFNKIKGFTIKKDYDPIRIESFEKILNEIKELFDEILASEYSNKKYVSLLNDTYETIDSLVLAAKII